MSDDTLGDLIVSESQRSQVGKPSALLTSAKVRADVLRVIERFEQTPAAPRTLAAVCRVYSQYRPDGPKREAFRRFLESYPHDVVAQRIAQYVGRA
jgi:hypothetical protein